MLQLLDVDRFGAIFTIRDRLSAKWIRRTKGTLSLNREEKVMRCCLLPSIKISTETKLFSPTKVTRN
ncbi:hypothetical protein BDZ94DRAFT_1248729 [Collybia nuda]|uniref:Uncharacterized protein n=1 Tax=Collybia nuda TaxID=64659 RepID=A0A9P5YFE1_9AGAR|nr:hypothetical protein BDZ94DRAFT_1248729 [Collybia nuda]